MSTENLISAADRLRDQRRFEEAAEAYIKAISVFEGRSDLWVQLGNMYKDAGNIPQAKRAYYSAIALESAAPDTFLQLGRACKVGGDLQGAAEAFIKAISIDRSCQAAIDELILIDRPFRSREMANLGFRLLTSAAQAVSEIREALFDLESRLPSIKNLAAVPIENFYHFKMLFKTASPPALDRNLNLCVVSDSEAGLLYSSLQKQTVIPKSTVFLKANNSALRLGDLCNEELLGAALNAHFSQLKHDLVVVFAPADTELDPHAIAWIFYVLEKFKVDAVYWDTEYLLQGEARPWFRSTLDPASIEALDTFAVRINPSNQNELSLLLQKGARAAFSSRLFESFHDRSIAHIPRLLSKCPFGWNPEQVLLKRNLLVSPGGKQRLALSVIIPTRDRADDLEGCVQSLAKECSGENVEFIILDNGSVEPKTEEVFSKLKKMFSAKVLSVNEPFNWSRLNNLGVQQARGELIVFCNNDIEMICKGWDLFVAEALSQSGVGAVGAKLLYPSGTIQHAGIIAGFGNGALEHESRGTMVTAASADRANRLRSVAAVTGAFLATLKETFWNVGGFDEKHFPIFFNDIDYCFRVRAAGKRILYEPELVGIHKESLTLRSNWSEAKRAETWNFSYRLMREKWGAAMDTDPSVNPTYAKCDPSLSLLTEPSETEILSYIENSKARFPWILPPPKIGSILDV